MRHGADARLALTAVLGSPSRHSGGLVRFWAKGIDVSFANINAKAEGIEGKPAFREAFQRRRCLVPVDNF
jgi:putative SOS response-associated peptidase YedK